ncbi:hypothetical protein SAMN04489732_10332 [Amycolatopsis saalfeldensis]|uniref:Uncharacterized protein n=1 Tax=Amycolatopsis saalfeldensis TaxID=394193 RepID=A0A1H8U289_9PSEU|nr:hypothetical protein SAMN04489732_10332 [Amycolatopsis saalfeldensis]
MAGTEVICLFIVAFLMRETTGKHRGRDFGLVSAAKCNIT